MAFLTRSTLRGRLAESTSLVTTVAILTMELSQDSLGGLSARPETRIPKPETRHTESTSLVATAPLASSSVQWKRQGCRMRILKRAHGSIIPDPKPETPISNPETQAHEVGLHVGSSAAGSGSGIRLLRPTSECGGRCTGLPRSNEMAPPPEELFPNLQRDTRNAGTRSQHRW